MHKLSKRVDAQVEKFDQAAEAAKIATEKVQQLQATVYGHQGTGPNEDAMLAQLFGLQPNPFLHTRCEPMVHDLRRLLANIRAAAEAGGAKVSAALPSSSASVKHAGKRPQPAAGP
jgi:hypothetical protein